jgi:uncharacterized membrane protein YdfJ with MMPL/SSD domain
MREMRDRTIVIAFFGFIVLTSVFLSGSIFAVIAVVVVLLVVGIVVALKPRRSPSNRRNAKGPAGNPSSVRPRQINPTFIPEFGVLFYVSTHAQKSN